MAFLYRYSCNVDSVFYLNKPYRFGDIIEIASSSPPEGFTSTTKDIRTGSHSSYTDLDGTWYMGNNVSGWDDERFPFVGIQIDTSAGRIDYNYTECSLDFQANAIYPTDKICIIAQMSHKKKLLSPVRPHIHWFQEEDNFPNFIMDYRWYLNGGEVPDFETAIADTHIFPYGTKTLQVSTFPEIQPPAGESLSSFIDIKFSRDVANSSGLFSGTDPYTLTVKTKELDIHVLTDAPAGSGREFQK